MSITAFEFIEIKPAYNGMCKFYFKNNLEKISVYKEF